MAGPNEILPWCIPAGEGNECIVCEGSDPNKPGNIMFVVRAPMGPADRYRISHEFLAEQAALIVKAVNAFRTPAPADLAEECAKIAESHFGAADTSPGIDANSYDEACADIAKAIRDTYAHE